VFEIKPISREAIPDALAKAERYRFLNESVQAESICQDILRVDPNHQPALIILILALSDQLNETLAVQQAQRLIPRLEGEYERHYYGGIIAERAGRAYMNQQRPGSAFKAFECFREAMDCFEKAERIRPAGNDDAILRWNTCARVLNNHPELRARPEESYEPILGE
jgi:tetratricopeptide (TPR) repeat protein